MGSQASVFRYPGGKSKLIPKLEPYLKSLLNKENKFLDLFVGGGSILIWVAKNYPEINLFANDKNKDLAAFWSIIATTNSTAINQLKTKLNIIPTLDLFYQIKNFTSDDPIEQAFKIIFLNRTSFSGIGINPIGGKNQTSKYKVDCRFNYDKLIKQIDNLHSLFKNRLTITNQDFSQCELFMENNIPTYLDPPYFVAGDQLYHQSMNKSEHQKLSSFLNKRKKWLLSYDDHLEIKTLYWQHQIDFIDARYSVDGKKSNWKQKQELVIYPYV